MSGPGRATETRIPSGSHRNCVNATWPRDYAAGAPACTRNRSTLQIGSKNRIGIRGRCCAQAFGLLVLVLALPAYAQQAPIATRHMNSDAEPSELSIVAAKVQLLLIAPNGKQTGYDARTKKKLRAIPDSAYYEDALLTYDSGRVDPDTTQTITVRHPAAGTYRLAVSPGTAAEGEEYEIHVNLYLQGGGEARTTRIAGAVQLGKVAMYELSVRNDPGDVTVLNHTARAASEK